LGEKTSEISKSVKNKKTQSKNGMGIPVKNKKIKQAARQCIE
jgi:hypothetical protein